MIIESGGGDSGERFSMLLVVGHTYHLASNGSVRVPISNVNIEER